MQNDEVLIQNLRAEIDLIHVEMVRLLRQRLQLVQKIWALKKNMKSPMVDEAREELLIHQFDAEINNIHEKTSVQNFLKFVVAESKSFMVKYDDFKF